MNWEALGAIAEISGAMAVVVSLIYVAVQIKHSANEAATTRSSTILDEFNRMQEVLISTPDVVELFAKMKEEEELTRTEDMLLGSVANRYLTHWYSCRSPSTER